MPSPIADGVVFSGMMSKVAVAPFLKKMHEMVEDPMTDQVISWSESGESFVVWRQLEFSRDLLPQSFKHNNFSSFVRQLSNYVIDRRTSGKYAIILILTSFLLVLFTGFPEGDTGEVGIH